MGRAVKKKRTYGNKGTCIAFLETSKYTWHAIGIAVKSKALKYVTNGRVRLRTCFYWRGEDQMEYKRLHIQKHWNQTSINLG